MKDVLDNERISAYLDGELDAQEQAQVEQMLTANPTARQLVDDLRALSSRLQSLPKEKLGEDLSERVLQVAQRRMLTEPSPAAKAAPAQPVPPIEPAPWRKLVRRFATPRTLFWPVVAASVALWLALYHPSERAKAPHHDAEPHVAMEAPRSKGSLQDAQIHAQPAKSVPSSVAAHADKMTPADEVRKADKADEESKPKLAEKSGVLKFAEKSEMDRASSFSAGGVHARSESAAANAAPERRATGERKVAKDGGLRPDGNLAAPLSASPATPAAPAVMPNKDSDAARSGDASTPTAGRDRAKAPAPAAPAGSAGPPMTANGPGPSANLAAKQARAPESLKKENLAQDKPAERGQAKEHAPAPAPAEMSASGQAAAGGGTRKAKADAPTSEGRKLESQMARPFSGMAMKAPPPAKAGKGAAVADAEAVVWCNIRSETIRETSLDELLARRHIAVQERSVVNNWSEVVSQVDQLAAGQKDAKRSQLPQAAPAFQAARQGMRGETQVLLQTEITPGELQAVLEELKSQGHVVQVIDQRGSAGQLAQQALRSQQPPATAPADVAARKQPSTKADIFGGMVQEDLDSARAAQKQRSSKPAKIARSADQRESAQATESKAQANERSDAKPESPAQAAQGVGAQAATSRQRVVFVVNMPGSPVQRAADPVSESSREGRPASEASPARPAKSSKPD